MQVRPNLTVALDRVGDIVAVLFFQLVKALHKQGISHPTASRHGQFVCHVADGSKVAILVKDEVDTAFQTPAAPVCAAQNAARGWEISFPNQLFVWSTCVGVYDCLLRGKVYGMIQHCKLWDLAGGLPLLKLAGFEARGADGHELGLDVVSGCNFYLENGPHRWRQKDYVVIAPDRQGTEAIWNQVKAKNLS